MASMSDTATGEDEGSRIHLQTDRPLQERLWMANRVGWAVMLVLVVVAILGLTGSGGWLSHHQLRAGDATIDLPRIGRWAAADHLSVEFAPEQRGSSRVTVPQSFLDLFAIEAVSPRPSSVVATPEGHIYTFDLSGTGGGRSARFSLRPPGPAWPTSVTGFAVDGSQAPAGAVVVLP